MQNPFSENDYKLLQSLVGLSQAGLKDSLSRFLTKRYKKVVNTNEYIYAQGNIPVALVAHMDTVFKFPPEPDEIFYDRQKGVIWSCAGLGADDRAGVFAILRIIQKGYYPTIIFTTDEEVGGKGADAFVKAFPEAPTEIKYVIQLDRRGAKDCVFYHCDNANFVDYVESFGFEENWGSFSDISIICPRWKIAGVNLSVGYEDEHNYIERLYVRHLWATINKVVEMLKVAKDAPTFIYVEASYYARNSLWNFDNWFTYDDEKMVKCAGCGKSYEEDYMVEVYAHDKSKKYYCLDCCDKLEWCSACGSAFEIVGNGKTCPVCGKDMSDEFLYPTED